MSGRDTITIKGNNPIRDSLLISHWLPRLRIKASLNISHFLLRLRIKERLLIKLPGAWGRVSIWMRISEGSISA